jgi:hypothetical protein
LEELAMYKKQRRSAMRLINTSYFKVSKGKIDYFIKERSYVSKFDGDVITEFITEETFNKNLEDGKRVEFCDFEDSPLNIKRTIEGEFKSAVS